MILSNHEALLAGPGQSLGRGELAMRKGVRSVIGRTRDFMPLRQRRLDRAVPTTSYILRLIVRWYDTDRKLCCMRKERGRYRSPATREAVNSAEAAAALPLRAPASVPLKVHPELPAHTIPCTDFVEASDVSSRDC